MIVNRCQLTLIIDKSIDKSLLLTNFVNKFDNKNRIRRRNNQNICSHQKF